MRIEYPGISFPIGLLIGRKRERDYKGYQGDKETDR